MINDEGKRVIKESEGFRNFAYKCPAGVWTIGYGSTFYLDGSKVKAGDEITQEHALVLLDEILERYEHCVRLSCTYIYSYNEYSALVSFCYNIGETAFRKSTLCKYMNVKEFDRILIAKEFMRWIKINGKISKGLKMRRDREVTLFLKPDNNRDIEYYQNNELLKTVILQHSGTINKPLG
jgi:lysozyme